MSDSGRRLRAIMERPPMPGMALSACLALLLQLALLSTVGPSAEQSADFDSHYGPAAASLLAGDGLRDASGGPALRYPPGYSVLIAGAWASGDLVGLDRGTSLAWAAAWWIALAAAAFHLLARSLLRPFQAALATGLWLTYLPLVWLGRQANSETPFFAPLFVGLWCVVRAHRGLERRDRRRWVPWCLAAGALLGVASLIRPVGLFLVVALAAALLWSHRRAPRDTAFAIACIVLAQMVVVLPWELWLHRHTGGWPPLSTGAKLSVLDGLTIAIKPEREGPWVPAGVVDLMWDVQANRREIQGPLSAARFLADRARDQPLAVAQLLAIKAARCWYATDSLRMEGVLLALQVPYLLLAFWGLARRPRGGEGERLLVPLVLAVTLYSWATTCAVLSILRYMMPAMALLMVPAAAGLERSGRRLLRLPDGEPTATERRPMRILFTLPNLTTAGSGRALFEIARRLDRRHFEPGLAVLRRGGGLEAEFAAAGIEVVALPFTVPARPLATLPLRLLRAARGAHAAGGRAWDLWHSFHYLDDYTEPLIARMAGARAWVYTKKNMSWNERSWALRTAFASCVLAQNRDMLERFFPTPRRRRKTRLVPRGVDSERFHPPTTARARRSDEPARVGVVAHLVAVKGHPTLFDAVGRVPGVRLEIAGRALDEDYVDRLRVRADQADLAGRVTLHGPVDDIATFLHGLDVFVLPTWARWRQEGCPVALLEAMASGLPCIATAIPGSRDLIDDGACGLLVPPEDVVALAEALETLVSAPDLARRLGTCARQRVEQQYAIGREVADHEDVYRWLLAERRTR